MKKLLLCAITLLTTPVFAGVNCIDNTENLENVYDTKQWHSVDCNCDCKDIRNNICVECGHKQEAHPQIIIQQPTSHTAQRSTIQAPPTVQKVTKNLIALKNKLRAQ